MEQCALCSDHELRIEKLEHLVEFLSMSLRFIAVATPIILGIASFAVLVSK